MIIGILGKSSAGKDTVGKIIQLLTAHNELENKNLKDILRQFEYCEQNKLWNTLVIKNSTPWEIKKFADKLKDITCLLIGCTRDQLEDHNFKEKELSEEWVRWCLYDKDYILKGLCSTKEEVENKYGEDGGYYILIKEKLTPRKLMQLLGTECGREIIHPNIWCNSLFADYKKQGSIASLSDSELNLLIKKEIAKLPNWIITDVRFPNEIQAIKDRGGIVIRVGRDVKNTSNHISETSLDEYFDWDWIINNNSPIENLVKEVKKFLKYYKIL